MTRKSGASFALLTVLALGSTRARGQTAPAQTPAPDERSTAQPQSGPRGFEESRRLLQQGKFDDALATLRGMEQKNPAMAGLAHEFGVAYYKKNDFVNAITYLKKAQEENPGDAEAVQL